MVKDRFLLGILIGISVLIVAALVLFFARQGNNQYLEDTQPASVLRNYILAIQRGDYERAHGALANFRERPSLERFRQTFETYQANTVENTAVEITSDQGSEVDGERIISLTILRGGGGLFSEVYRTQEQATLVQENGEWKIKLAPYPFWGYNWEYEFEQQFLTPAP